MFIKGYKVDSLPFPDEELRFRELVMPEAAGVQVLHRLAPLPPHRIPVNPDKAWMAYKELVALDLLCPTAPP